jgi:predicted O-methyltransferase YrrM
VTSTLWERDGHEVTDEEGECLASLARRVAPGLCIVEVGSYRGRSTSFLAQGSHEGHAVPIYAVDLWTDAPELQATRKGNLKPYPYRLSETRAAFDDAMSYHGHGLVTAIQGDSVTVAKAFRQPVGLLFLDGSHAYGDVYADLTAWSPKVPYGGKIALHDWHFRAVRKAARRTLRPDFMTVDHVGRIRVVQMVIE